MQADGKVKKTSTPMKVTPVKTNRGFKESKSDHMSLSSKQKAPLQGKSVGSPLGKPYLSKSYENLSLHQKKKLSTYIDHRPKSSLGLPKADNSGKQSNKENFQQKDKEGFLKPKPVKALIVAPIRKASSTQHIDKSGNSGGTGGATTHKTYTSRMQAMKRAHSQQNVSKDKQARKRTSAPADVMAYNAELLANFEKDKKLLEARISELVQVAENRKAEIEKFKYETKNLKEQIPSHDLKDEIQFLRSENKLYMDQLKDLGHPVEQITDTEKLSRLQANKGCKSVEGSVPKSISCDSLSTDGQCNTGKYDTADRSVTSEPGLSLNDICSQVPEHPSLCSFEISANWEKGSNKSSDALSEVSVAGLTERIQQMEESHYSTNEELQATLQELGDLQHSVNELTDENERLFNERNILLESLCTQTEKLQHCRIQIEQLKSLLISGTLPDTTTRELQLLELLKAGQVEREEMICKQNEYANALHNCEHDLRESQDAVDATRDKSLLLEDTASSLKAERDTYARNNSELKEQMANNRIEISHYKTLLENEKTRVQELDQYCAASKRSDLEELLHNALQEKDKLEDKCANTMETLLHSQNEVENLRETLRSREEELKVTKNNGRTQVHDFEYKIERLDKEREDNKMEIESLRQRMSEEEHDADQLRENKKCLTVELQGLRKQIDTLLQEKVKVDTEVRELREKMDEKSEEWHQFQKDLQVAVLVANDFRAETQEDRDKIQQDNATLSEQVVSLQSENDKLREENDCLKSQKSLDEKSSTPKSIMSNAELKGKVLCTVDRELLHLRDKRQDKNATQSVKSLIRSIEEQVKSGCSSLHSSTCSSRRNSDTADGSLSGIREFQDLVKSPSSPNVEGSPLFNTSSPDVTLRSALKKTEKPSPIRLSVGMLSFDSPRSPLETGPKSAPPTSKTDTSPTISSILSNRPSASIRRSSTVGLVESGDRKEGSSKDPLSMLSKQMGGSKRNALLKWCQQKTINYPKVDITNFSSSWNDGLAFCALLHSYIPNKIPYADLSSEDKRSNFNYAFEAAEGVGISSSILNINDMVVMERPDWQAVMAYVTSIYKHFEIDARS
ncbi:cytospin-A-like [Mizuhopecten yessoensis]|uniref:Cytospin-A n=1 Tax=Mizuhopecten yessoensis TaxID=6573 RepID=A0A210R029_MIZYE|nr:cytospin-A-like [Mizuhopecten yessoensis]XP_021345396.1 cytospin-A-like [Mizuhopecten yessoensis]XP_021345397.1 cytospin-A-like [Mizuhopecten yessoensis]OWF54366.1 Cytospin-A [Mizuhopecten yessoensis]